MSNPILTIQTMLKDIGMDPGPLDGQWGPRTEEALRKALIQGVLSNNLAWGNKVSAGFRLKVRDICQRQVMNPNYLMSCMAFESAETFSPAIRNAAGSGATGLIQFMPRTAISLGTTVDLLAQMTAEQQLDFVEKYFVPYRGRLHTLADHYMAILWPAAIGKSSMAPLWTKEDRPTTFRQNAGLDTNKDGVITVSEAAGKIQEKLLRGLSPPFVWRAS